MKLSSKRKKKTKITKKINQTKRKRLKERHTE